MRIPENTDLPFESVQPKLTKDDDRQFWQIALAVLGNEFITRYDEDGKGREWLLVVGVCSHWARPHNSSWQTKAGRFVAPYGYQESPELDWSVILSYQGRRWMLVRTAGKRKTIFRVSIPARTARHKQAAVNAQWYPDRLTVYYGFRNVDGHWRCVAASDETSQGRISPG